MKIHNRFWLSALFSAAALVAVNTMASPLPQQPHIYVEGSAELEVEPDMMVFSLSIQTVDMDLAKAKADVDARSRLLIDASKKYNAKVLLAAMQIPPNYGARYSNQFKELYPKLATKNDIALVPFLLEGIGGNAELMQRDGIHPTAEAQPIIVNNVLPELLSVLENL